MIEQIAMLSQEEKGNLLDCILQYGNTGDIPVTKGNERFLFPGIKWQMDRDQEKYAEKCKINSENRKKAFKNNEEEDEEEITNINDRQRPLTNVNGGDQEKEKEEEEENEDEKEKEDEKDKLKKYSSPSLSPHTGAQARKEREKAKEALEAYQRLCPSLKPVTVLTPNREKALTELFKTYELSDIEAAFVKAESSSFLKGMNPRRWVASFDFIIDPNNFAKLVEGNYDDEEPNDFSDRSRECGWEFEEDFDDFSTEPANAPEQDMSMCKTDKTDTYIPRFDDAFDLLGELYGEKHDSVQDFPHYAPNEPSCGNNATNSPIRPDSAPSMCNSHNFAPVEPRNINTFHENTTENSEFHTSEPNFSHSAPDTDNVKEVTNHAKTTASPETMCKTHNSDSDNTRNINTFHENTTENGEFHTSEPNFSHSAKNSSHGKTATNPVNQPDSSPSMCKSDKLQPETDGEEVDYDELREFISKPNGFVPLPTKSAPNTPTSAHGKTATNSVNQPDSTPSMCKTDKIPNVTHNFPNDLDLLGDILGENNSSVHNSSQSDTQKPEYGNNATNSPIRPDSATSMCNSHNFAPVEPRNINTFHENTTENGNFHTSVHFSPQTSPPVTEPSHRSAPIFPDGKSVTNSPIRPDSAHTMGKTAKFNGNYAPKTGKYTETRHGHGRKHSFAQKNSQFPTASRSKQMTSRTPEPRYGKESAEAFATSWAIIEQELAEIGARD